MTTTLAREKTVKIGVGTGQVMLNANTLKGWVSHMACESGLLFGFEDSEGITPSAFRRRHPRCARCGGHYRDGLLSIRHIFRDVGHQHPSR
jgi:hypothetical protein